MKTEDCLSCVGCKFLYGQGEGYSNWTWMETIVHCALNLNPNLLNGAKEMPYDWKRDNPCEDNFPMTQNSRCSKYAPGIFVELDVDGEDGPASYSKDEEQIKAICEHSKRGREGYER